MFIVIAIVGICVYLAAASEKHLDNRIANRRGSVEERAAPYRIPESLEKRLYDECLDEANWKGIWDRIELFKRNNYVLCSIQDDGGWIQVHNDARRTRPLFKDYRWGMYRDFVGEIVDKLAMTYGGYTKSSAMGIANKLS